MTSLAKTGTLVGLILRRDRLIMPIWVVVLAGFVVGTASSFAAAYPTPAARQAFVDSVASNPAIRTVLGPVTDPSIGGLAAWRVGTAGDLLFAVVALVTIVRHTRTEEETGRRELIGSAAVGRHAPLTAALVVTAAANLLVALLIAAGMASAAGQPFSGSLALGLSLASIGWIFAAVGGVTAQLTENHRTATGLGLALVGVATVLRIAADAGGPTGDTHWLRWLTPVGWIQRLDPFTDTRWWIFGLVAVVVAVLTATAYALQARRDLGAGLLPDRLGPAAAAPSLRSPLALAWRQHRGLLLAVTIGFALVGSLLGAVANGAAQAGPQLGPFLAKLGVSNSGQALLVLLIYVFAEVISAYAILVALRPRTEELDGLAEPLLAAPVSRLRWASSHLLVAVVGPVIVVTVLGVTVGIAYGLTTGDVAHPLLATLLAALAKIPAIWVMVGVATALVGLLPRLAAAGSWAALGLVVVLELGWELGRVSDVAFSLSPFSHVYPLAGHTSPAALIGLTIVAAALAAVGLGALQRRDIG